MTDELLDWIEAACARMPRVIEGLDEQQLRAPVVASGWTMLGLLGHVRGAVAFWMHHVVEGNPLEFDDDDDAWVNDPQLPADQVIQRFRDEIPAACAAVRGTPADAPPGWWPEGAWGGYRQDTVGGVLLHVLNEVATHAGHLDLARELTDGGVWDFAIDRVRVPGSVSR